MTQFERFHAAEELDVNFLNKYEDYPRNFLKAIHKGDKARLDELLLQYDSTSKMNLLLTKESIFHLAVRFGSLSLVNRLIELGADVNAENCHNQTPLYNAIQRGAEMVKILLDNGAKVNIFDEIGATPLHQALISGSVETANLLLNNIYNQELHFNTKESQNDIDKCGEIVKNYLYLGTKLNWKKYPTLLHFAAKYGDEETFNLVLTQTKDIDIGAYNPNYQSFSHFLINTGKINLIKRLYKCKVNLNQDDHMNRTLLNYAIMKKDSTIVNFLLDNGTDIHHKDWNGLMPLSYAVRYENKAIMKRLLESGADINKTKYFNGDTVFTPFHESLGYQYSKFLTYINKFDSTEYPKDTRNKNINDCNGCSLEIIQFLIEKGANVKAKLSNELIPLVVAYTAGRSDAEQLLLNHEANVPENNACCVVS